MPWELRNGISIGVVAAAAAAAAMVQDDSRRLTKFGKAWELLMMTRLFIWKSGGY